MHHLLLCYTFFCAIFEQNVNEWCTDHDDAVMIRCEKWHVPLSWLNFVYFYSLFWINVVWGSLMYSSINPFLMSLILIHYTNIIFLWFTVTQSEQDRSCILLVRMQKRSGDFLWVHVVLQVRDGHEANQQPVIVCTNQVLRWVLSKFLNIINQSNIMSKKYVPMYAFPMYVYGEYTKSWYIAE